MSETARKSLSDELGRWIGRLLEGLGVLERPRPAPVPVRVRDQR